MQSLGVLSHDTMEVKEETEDIDLLGDESNTSTTEPAKRRVEGRAFGGTLLGYSSSSSPPHTPSQDVVAGPSAGQSCPACTFDNTPDAFTCAMCETVLGGVPD